MIPCMKCGRKAFLYKGLCDTCAPGLHAQLAGEMAAYDEIAAEFELETGKKPLDDWWGFEGFINRKISQTTVDDLIIPPEVVELIQISIFCESRWLNFIRDMGDRLGLRRSSALRIPTEEAMVIEWTTKDD